MLLNPMSFSSDEASHGHALETLSVLRNYDDFMRSIDTLCDVGCGAGLDLEWWATRYTLDDNENEIPLNIKCTGIDQQKSLSAAKRFDNVVYQRGDFEREPLKKHVEI